MPDRVIVFIDEQNFYRGARRAYFSDADQRTRGNSNPTDLGSLIAGRLPIGVKEARSFQQVRVYTGLPDPTREPKGHAAHTRRMTAWEKAGAVVVSRPLRYLPPSYVGQQKGVDVALAIDFVDLALDSAFDVGVICSTDTDLSPALEFVLKRCRHIRPEVASWWSYKHQKQMSRLTWCHRLGEADYKAVCDHTDYNLI